VVDGPGRQSAAIGRDGHGMNGSGVALERLQADARLGVPELDRLVAGAGRQPAAIGREGHGRNRIRMALERLQASVPIRLNFWR
jgi:hypothetical protein